MLKGQIIKFAGKVLLTLTFIMMTHCCQAQDNNLFNGAGINMGGSNQGSGKKTRIFDFSELKPKADSPKFKFPKFEMPKWQAPKMKMPNMFQQKDYPKAVQMTDEKPNTFGMPNMKNMFGPKETSQPNFFQRMNDRNKEFWGKARDNFANWSTETNENMRKGTASTWENITRGFGGKKGSAQPPAQPPLRSAKRDGSPTRRY